MRVLRFGADNNNVLQLLLQPVLSFSDLFVFPNVMHELNLTDGSFPAETTTTTVNCRTETIIGEFTGDQAQRLPQWFSLHVQTAEEEYQGQSLKVTQGKHLH